jgi:hypothetical protein
MGTWLDWEPLTVVLFILSNVKNNLGPCQSDNIN